MTRDLGFLVAALVLTASSVASSEPERISIQRLLSPQGISYESHLVTLQGRASGIHITPPFSFQKCPVLYGRAAFTLQDDTGALTVHVLGSCFRPGAVEALPKDGEHVRVTAIVHVLSADPPIQVRVQAIAIEILDSNRTP